MKALLIDTRTGGDWSLDLLFAGLVYNLGARNVVDFPSKDKHREGPIVLTGDPEKDWGRERRSLGYTGDVLGPRRSLDEVREMIVRREFDVIFLDERVESFQVFVELRANYSGIPTVVVAGHDRLWNPNGPAGIEMWYGNQLRAMFLDNWRPEYANFKKAHVYNWSVNFDHYWDRASCPTEKIYDISFMGYNSHPDRAVFIDHVLSKWGHLNNHIFLERTPDTMRGFIPKREYFRVMKQSKICLNLRGAAENGKTLRFYEIPYVGSLMLSQDSGAVQTEPALKPGMHYGSFKNVQELDGLIDYYLNYAPMDNYCAAAAAHQHVMKYHTAKARVKDMLEVIFGQK